MENDFDPIYFYNNFSKTYDKLTHPDIFDPEGTYERDFAYLVASLNPRSILEIGCGTGKRLHALVKYYKDLNLRQPHITAMDPSRDMLAKIPSVVKDNVTLLNALSTTPFADNSVDLVFTSGVLCSIQNKDAVTVAREAYRISKQHSLHTDTPKDKPHLNDLDLFKFFNQSQCQIIFWNTIYPYPVPGEFEHQIVLSKQGTPKFLDHFPLRSNAGAYEQTWKEILVQRMT